MEIRFRVRDNGIGMSPEFLPHLYDPFSQERSEENITENLMDARILLVEDKHLCGPADPGKSRMCGGDCKRYLSLP